MLTVSLSQSPDCAWVIARARTRIHMHWGEKMRLEKFSASCRNALARKQQRMPQFQSFADYPSSEIHGTARQCKEVVVRKGFKVLLSRHAESDIRDLTCKPACPSGQAIYKLVHECVQASKSQLRWCGPAFQMFEPIQTRKKNASPQTPMHNSSALRLMPGHYCEPVARGKRCLWKHSRSAPPS